MKTVVASGDTAGSPTVSYEYGVDEGGFRKITTKSRKDSGLEAVYTVTTYLDGFGREVRTKSSLNRLVLKNYPEGTDVSYVYDNDGGVLDGSCPGNTDHKGNLSKVTDASGESAFCYDFAGRVVSSFIQGGRYGLFFPQDLQRAGAYDQHHLSPGNRYQDAHVCVQQRPRPAGGKKRPGDVRELSE